MIITRSPLRITLGGGGTDLPSFYEKHGGYTLSAAIDKYVYVTINKAFDKEILIRYSQTERVENIEQIRHPIIRECLRLVPPHNDRIEITSMADVPAGTGLGSSGAFTCALLKALHAYNGEHISTEELAAMACKIEIEYLQEPVGKQDQYISAYGGIQNIYYEKKGVWLKKAVMPENYRNHFEDNLHLFFTGKTRSASQILTVQKMSIEATNTLMINNLMFTKANGMSSADALSVGDFDRFADNMNQQWDLKMERSNMSTTDDIVKRRELAITRGAEGCKLVGAGGGGFLLAYWVGRKPLAWAGIGDELRFQFDYEGTKRLI